MGLEVPENVRGLFLVLTGEKWPSVDEDALWHAAEAWGIASDRMRNEAGPYLLRVVQDIRENFSGKSAIKFAEMMGPYITEPPYYLPQAADQFKGLQQFLDEAGTQVEYVKIISIEELVLLIAQIAWAIAAAYYTAGSSLVWLAGRFVVVRFLLQRLWGRLLLQFAMAELFGIAFQLALDVLTQTVQFAKGSRSKWDTRSTLMSVEVGAMGGALTVPFSLIAHQVSKYVTKAFSKLLGKEISLAELNPFVVRAVNNAHEQLEHTPISAVGKDATGKVSEKIVDGVVKSVPEPLRVRLVKIGIPVLIEVTEEGLHEAITEGLVNQANGQGFSFNPFSFTSGVAGGMASALGHGLGHKLAGPRPEAHGYTQLPDEPKTDAEPDPTDDDTQPLLPSGSSVPDSVSQTTLVDPATTTPGGGNKHNDGPSASVPPSRTSTLGSIEQTDSETAYGTDSRSDGRGTASTPATEPSGRAGAPGTTRDDGVRPGSQTGPAVPPKDVVRPGSQTGPAVPPKDVVRPGSQTGPAVPPKDVVRPGSQTGPAVPPKDAVRSTPETDPSAASRQRQGSSPSTTTPDSRPPAKSGGSPRTTSSTSLSSSPSRTGSDSVQPETTPTRSGGRDPGKPNGPAEPAKTQATAGADISRSASGPNPARNGRTTPATGSTTETPAARGSANRPRDTSATSDAPRRDDARPATTPPKTSPTRTPDRTTPAKESAVTGRAGSATNQSTTNQNTTNQNITNQNTAHQDARSNPATKPPGRSSAGNDGQETNPFRNGTSTRYAATARRRLAEAAGQAAVEAHRTESRSASESLAGEEWSQYCLAMVEDLRHRLIPGPIRTSRSREEGEITVGARGLRLDLGLPHEMWAAVSDWDTLIGTVARGDLGTAAFVRIGRPGEVGHAVVLYRTSDDGVVLVDPTSPGEFTIRRVTATSSPDGTGRRTVAETLERFADGRDPLADARAVVITRDGRDITPAPAPSMAARALLDPSLTTTGVSSRRRGDRRQPFGPEAGDGFLPFRLKPETKIDYARRPGGVKVISRDATTDEVIDLSTVLQSLGLKFQPIRDVTMPSYDDSTTFGSASVTSAEGSEPTSTTGRSELSRDERKELGKAAQNRREEMARRRSEEAASTVARSDSAETADPMVTPAEGSDALSSISRSSSTGPATAGRTGLTRKERKDLGEAAQRRRDEAAAARERTEAASGAAEDGTSSPSTGRRLGTGDGAGIPGRAESELERAKERWRAATEVAGRASVPADRSRATDLGPGFNGVPMTIADARRAELAAKAAETPGSPDPWRTPGRRLGAGEGKGIEGLSESDRARIKAKLRRSRGGAKLTRRMRPAEVAPQARKLGRGWHRGTQGPLRGRGIEGLSETDHESAAQRRNAWQEDPEGTKAGPAGPRRRTGKGSGRDPVTIDDVRTDDEPAADRGRSDSSTDGLTETKSADGTVTLLEQPKPEIQRSQASAGPARTDAVRANSPAEATGSDPGRTESSPDETVAETPAPESDRTTPETAATERAAPRAGLDRTSVERARGELATLSESEYEQVDGEAQAIIEDVSAHVAAIEGAPVALPDGTRGQVAHTIVHSGHAAGVELVETLLGREHEPGQVQVSDRVVSAEIEADIDLHRARTTLGLLNDEEFASATKAMQQVVGDLTGKVPAQPDLGENPPSRLDRVGILVAAAVARDARATRDARAAKDGRTTPDEQTAQDGRTAQDGKDGRALRDVPGAQDGLAAGEALARELAPLLRDPFLTLRPDLSHLAVNDPRVTEAVVALELVRRSSPEQYARIMHEARVIVAHLTGFSPARRPDDRHALRLGLLWMVAGNEIAWSGHRAAENAVRDVVRLPRLETDSPLPSWTAAFADASRFDLNRARATLALRYSGTADGLRDAARNVVDARGDVFYSGEGLELDAETARELVAAEMARLGPVAGEELAERLATEPPHLDKENDPADTDEGGAEKAGPSEATPGSPAEESTPDRRSEDAEEGIPGQRPETTVPDSTTDQAAPAPPSDQAEPVPFEDLLADTRLGVTAGGRPVAIWLPGAPEHGIGLDAIEQLGVLAPPQTVFVLGAERDGKVMVGDRVVSAETLHATIAAKAPGLQPFLLIPGAAEVAGELAREFGGPVLAAPDAMRFEPEQARLSFSGPGRDGQLEEKPYRLYEPGRPEGLPIAPSLTAGPERQDGPADSTPIPEIVITDPKGQVRAPSTEPSQFGRSALGGMSTTSHAGGSSLRGVYSGTFLPEDGAPPVAPPPGAPVMTPAPEIHQMARSIGVPRAGLPYMRELLAGMEFALFARGQTFSTKQKSDVVQRLLSNFPYLLGASEDGNTSGLVVPIGPVEFLISFDPQDPQKVERNPAGSYLAPSKLPAPDGEHATVDTVSSSFQTGAHTQTMSGQAGATRGRIAASFGIGVPGSHLNVVSIGAALSGTTNQSNLSNTHIADAERGKVEDSRIQAHLIAYPKVNISFQVRDQKQGEAPRPWRLVPATRIAESGNEALLLWLADPYTKEPAPLTVTATGDEVRQKLNRLPRNYIASGMTNIPELVDEILRVMAAKGLKLETGNVTREALAQKLWNLNTHLDDVVNEDRGYEFSLPDARGRTIAVVNLRGWRAVWGSAAMDRPVGAMSDKSHLEDVRTAIDGTSGSHTLNQSSVLSFPSLEFDTLPQPVGTEVGLNVSLSASYSSSNSDSLSANRVGLNVMVPRYTGRTAAYHSIFSLQATVNVRDGRRGVPGQTNRVTSSALVRIPVKEAFAYGFPIDRSALKNPPAGDTMPYVPDAVKDTGPRPQDPAQKQAPQHVLAGKGVGMGLVRVADETVDAIMTAITREVGARGFLPDPDDPFAGHHQLSHGNRLLSRLDNWELLRKLVSIQGLDSHFDQIHQDGMTFTLRKRTGFAGADLDVDAVKITIKATQSADPAYVRTTNELHTVNLAMGMDTFGAGSSHARSLSVGVALRGFYKYLRGAAMGLTFQRTVGAADTVSFLNNRPELLEFPGDVDEFKLTSDYTIGFEYEHWGPRGRFRKGRRDPATVQVPNQQAVVNLLALGTLDERGPFMSGPAEKGLLDQALVYFVDTSGMGEAGRRVLPDLVGPASSADQAISTFTSQIMLRAHMREILQGEYTSTRLFETGLFRDDFGGLDISGELRDLQFSGAKREKFVKGDIKLLLAENSLTDNNSVGLTWDQLDPAVGGVAGHAGLSGEVDINRHWQWNTSRSSGRTGGIERLQLDFNHPYLFSGRVDFTVRGRQEKQTKLWPTASAHGVDRQVHGREMRFLLSEPEALKRYAQRHVPISDDQLGYALDRWRNGLAAAVEDGLVLSSDVVAGILTRWMNERGARKRVAGQILSFARVLVDTHQKSVSPVMDSDTRKAFNDAFARHSGVSLNEPQDPFVHIETPSDLRDWVMGKAELHIGRLREAMADWSAGRLRLSGDMVVQILVGWVGMHAPTAEHMQLARLLHELHSKGGLPVRDASNRELFNEYFGMGPWGLLPEPKVPLQHMKLPEFYRRDDAGGRILGHAGVQTYTHDNGQTTYEIVRDLIERVAPGMLAAGAQIWSRDGRLLGEARGGVDALQAMLAKGRDIGLFEELLSPNGFSFYLVNPVGWLLADVVEINLSSVLTSQPKVEEFVANTGIEVYSHGYYSASVAKSRNSAQAMTFAKLNVGGAQSTTGSAGGGLKVAEAHNRGTTRAEQGVTEQTVYDWSGHYLTIFRDEMTARVRRLKMSGRPLNNWMLDVFGGFTQHGRTETRTVTGKLVLQVPRGIAEAGVSHGPSNHRNLVPLPKLPGNAFIAGTLLDDTLPIARKMLTRVFEPSVVERMFGEKAGDPRTRSSLSLPVLTSRLHLTNHLQEATGGDTYTVAKGLVMPGSSNTRADIELKGALYDLEVIAPIKAGTGTGRYSKHQSGTSTFASTNQVRLEGDYNVDVHGQLGGSPEVPRTWDVGNSGSRVTSMNQNSSGTENYRREQHAKEQGPVFLVRLRFRGRLSARKFEYSLFREPKAKGVYRSDPITGDVYAELFQAEVDELRAQLEERMADDPLETEPWPAMDDAPSFDLATLLTDAARDRYDAQRAYQSVARDIRERVGADRPIVIRAEEAALTDATYRALLPWAVETMAPGLDMTARLGRHDLRSVVWDSARRRDEYEQYEQRLHGNRPREQWERAKPGGRYMSPTRHSAAEVDELIRVVQTMYAMRADNPLGTLPPMSDAASVLGQDPVYLARDVAHALETHVRVDIHRPDGTLRQRWITPSGAVHAFDPSRYFYDGEPPRLHVHDGQRDRTFNAALAHDNGLLSQHYRDEARAFGLTSAELGRLYLTAMANQQTFEQAVAAEVAVRRADLDALDGPPPVRREDRDTPHPTLSGLVRRAFDVREFWRGEVARRQSWTDRLTEWSSADHGPGLPAAPAELSEFLLGERTPAGDTTPMDEAHELYESLRGLGRADAQGPRRWRAATLVSIDARLNRMMDPLHLVQTTRLGEARRTWGEFTPRSAEQLETELLDAGMGSVSLVTLPRGNGVRVAVADEDEVTWHEYPSGRAVVRPARIASSLDLSGDGSVLTRAPDGGVRRAAELPELDLGTEFFRRFRTDLVGMVQASDPRTRPGPLARRAGWRPSSPDIRTSPSEDDFAAPSDPWGPRREISQRRPGTVAPMRRLSAVVRPPVVRHDLALTDMYLRIDEEGQAVLLPYERHTAGEMRLERVADYAAILWHEMGGLNRAVTIFDIVGRGWPHALDYFSNLDRSQGLQFRAFQAMDRSSTHIPRMASELPDDLAVDTQLWFSVRNTTGSAKVLPGGRALVYIVGRDSVQEMTIVDLRTMLGREPRLVIAESVVQPIVFPLHAVPEELRLDQAYVYENRRSGAFGVGFGGLSDGDWEEVGPLADYALIFRLTGFTPEETVDYITVAEVISDIGNAVRFLRTDPDQSMSLRVYDFLREDLDYNVLRFVDVREFPEHLPYGTRLWVHSGGNSGVAIALGGDRFSVYAPAVNVTGFQSLRYLDHMTQRPFTYVVARPRASAPELDRRFDETESPDRSVSGSVPSSLSEPEVMQFEVDLSEPDPHIYRRGANERRVSGPGLDEDGWRLEGSFREFAPLMWVTEGGAAAGTTVTEVLRTHTVEAARFYDLVRPTGRTEDAVRAYFLEMDPERIVQETHTLPVLLPPGTWVWYRGSERTGAMYVRANGLYRHLGPGHDQGSFETRERGLHLAGPGPHTYVIARPAEAEDLTGPEPSSPTSPTATDRRESLALLPARVYRVPEEVPLGLRITRAHLYRSRENGRSFGVGIGGLRAGNWRGLGALGPYALMYWLLSPNLNHGYDPEPEITLTQIVGSAEVVGLGFDLPRAASFLEMDPRLTEASRVAQFIEDHILGTIWTAMTLPGGLAVGTLIWGSGGGLTLAAQVLSGGYVHVYTLGEQNTQVLTEAQLRAITARTSYTFVIAVPEGAEERFDVGPVHDSSFQPPEPPRIPGGEGRRAITDAPFSPAGPDETRSHGAPSPSPEVREVTEGADDIVVSAPRSPSPGLDETGTSRETPAPPAEPTRAPGTAHEGATDAGTVHRSTADEGMVGGPALPELSGENAPDRETFNRLLRIHEMKEVDVAGDGNCLYNSLRVIAPSYLAMYLGLDLDTPSLVFVRALRRFLADRLGIDLALAERGEELRTRYAEHFVPEGVAVGAWRTELMNQLLEMGDYRHFVAEQSATLAASELGLPLTLVQYGQPNIDLGPPGGPRIYFIRDGEHFRGIESIHGGLPSFPWHDFSPREASTVEEARSRAQVALAEAEADFERDLSALEDAWRDLPGHARDMTAIDLDAVAEVGRTQVELATRDPYQDHPPHLRTQRRIDTIQDVAGTVREATQRLQELSAYLWLTHGRPAEDAIRDIAVDPGLTTALAALRTSLVSRGPNDPDPMPDWVATTLRTQTGRNARVTRQLPETMRTGTYVWFSGLGITGAGVVQPDGSISYLYRVADPHRSLGELLRRRLTYVIAEPGGQAASTSRAAVSDMEAFDEAQQDLPGDEDLGDEETGDPDPGAEDTAGRGDHLLPEDVDAAHDRLTEAGNAFWEAAGDTDLDETDGQAYQDAIESAVALVDQARAGTSTLGRTQWLREVGQRAAELERLTQRRRDRRAASGDTGAEEPDRDPSEDGADESWRAHDYPSPQDIASANDRLMAAVTAFWRTAVNAESRREYNAVFARASALVNAVRTGRSNLRRQQWIEEMQRRIADVQRLADRHESGPAESGSTREGDETGGAYDRPSPEDVASEDAPSNTRAASSDTGDGDPQAAPAQGTRGIADRPRGGALGFEAKFSSEVELREGADRSGFRIEARNGTLSVQLNQVPRNLTAELEQINQALAAYGMGQINQELTESGLGLVEQYRANVLEIVTAPITTAVPGDGEGRVIGEDVLATVERVYHGLEQAEGRAEGERIAIEEIFPEDLFEYSPDARGAHVSSGPSGLRLGLPFHFTAGVPITRMHEFLSEARDHTAPQEAARAHLADGLQFGNEIAAMYAETLPEYEGYEIPSYAVHLFARREDVSAVRGYMALVYAQIAPIVHGEPSRYLGIRSRAAAVSRISLAGILETLPEPVREFLDGNDERIEDALLRMLQYRNLEREDEPLSGYRLWDSEGDYDLGDYLDTALAPDMEEINQNQALGVRTHFDKPDTNDGRLQLPLVLVELRNLGGVEPRRQTLEDLKRHYAMVESMAKRRYTEALALKTAAITDADRLAAAATFEDLTRFQDAIDQGIAWVQGIDYVLDNAWKLDPVLQGEAGRPAVITEERVDRIVGATFALLRGDHSPAERLAVDLSAIRDGLYDLVPDLAEDEDTEEGAGSALKVADGVITYLRGLESSTRPRLLTGSGQRLVTAPASQPADSGPSTPEEMVGHRSVDEQIALAPLVESAYGVRRDDSGAPSVEFLEDALIEAGPGSISLVIAPHAAGDRLVAANLDGQVTWVEYPSGRPAAQPVDTMVRSLELGPDGMVLDPSDGLRQLDPDHAVFGFFQGLHASLTDFLGRGSDPSSPATPHSELAPGDVQVMRADVSGSMIPGLRRLLADRKAEIETEAAAQNLSPEALRQVIADDPTVQRLQRALSERTGNAQRHAQETPAPPDPETSGGIAENIYQVLSGSPGEHEAISSDEDRAWKKSSHSDQFCVEVAIAQVRIWPG
ncbi:hypothetical protein [Actinoallomurus sp. CA-142502]|uniref:WXG100-like domain-containing protein n=1 Tax=Actinoallomurus sp. CA-142502 TaxID=3239885 RepID=UPI003D942F95